MFQKKVTVSNETGIHARPASQLMKFCKQYPEEIRLANGDTEVDPKSIVSLLSGGIKKGTEIEVRVSGENEESVCNEIVEFINNLTE